MSGVLYVVFRSVRGLSRTIEEAAAGRGWGGQSHHLFPLHAQHGIAEDGSPTGIEHAIVYNFEFPVLQLRARWSDRAGARRLRELLLGDRDDKLGAALISPHTRRFPRGTPRSPYPTMAFDLDMIHALAGAARDADDLIARLAELPSTGLHGEGALPAEPLLEAARRTLGPPRDGKPPPPEIADPTERALVERICNAPADEHAAAVYADWLEQQGRHAEAAWLRS